MPVGSEASAGEPSAAVTVVGSASSLTVDDVEPGQLAPQPWATEFWTRLGMGLDGLLVRAMGLVVDAALAPAFEDVAAIRAGAAPYLRGELAENPSLFFSFLDASPDRIPEMVSERYKRPVRGGVVVARQFLSKYEAFQPPSKAAVPCLENERVPVEHWMHDDDKPRATVLALHGFTMGQPRLDAFALMAAEWFRRGLDVALMTLPYHGARSPRGARFSGEAFASPDVGRLNEAVRQAVSDACMLMSWLRVHSAAPVGLMGLSLGGYVSALIAGLSAQPAFVVPLVPPVDMADMAWRFYEHSQRARREAKSPLSRNEQNRAYRIHSPLAFPLRVSKERTLIVAGRGDRVVPATHPQALWLHWGKPDIFWFSGSHVAPFGRSRIVRRIAEHFTRIGIL